MSSTPLQRGLPNRDIVQIDLYTYKLDVQNLAPGTALNDSIQIEADSYFEIEKMSYMADIAGAAQTAITRPIPLVTVLLTDTGSGRNLMSDNVDITALAGSQGLPYITTVRRVLKPNSTLKCLFTSYEAAVTYDNVSLYLHGKKIWYA